MSVSDIAVCIWMLSVSAVCTAVRLVLFLTALSLSLQKAVLHRAGSLLSGGCILRTRDILKCFEYAETGFSYDSLDEQNEFEQMFLELDVTRPKNPVWKIRYSGFRDLAIMCFSPVTFGNVLYLYDETTGLYREGSLEMKDWILKKLSLLAGDAISEAFWYLPKTMPLSKEADEIYRRIFLSNVVSGDTFPFNQFAGIPVDNGVVVFDETFTPSLVPYKPSMRFTRKLSAKYNAEADTKAVLALLSSWVDACDVSCLVQIAAQALVQSLPGYKPFKKAYMIQGERNSGKSSFLELLEGLFGEKNLSHIDLQSLGDRFNDCSLVGSFLNTGDDLPSISLKDCGAFKKFTGKDWHDVEPKGKPRFNARITAVHVYSCNKTPVLSKSVECDDAFWDRWVVLRFPNAFAKRSGWFSSQVSSGILEGFLLLAVSCAASMLQSGGELFYVQDLEVTQNRWEQESSLLLDFLDEHTVRDREDVISKDELYDALFLYADEVGSDDDKARLPQSKMVLTQKMVREGYVTVQKGSKSRIMCYKGLSWKPGSRFEKKGTVNSVLG